MPSPFPNLPPERRGTLHRSWFDSDALSGNPWGDPTGRDLFVYVPRGCEGPLPAILFLAPFSGTGEKLLARGLSEESLAARLDRLFEAGCPPFLAVLPDTMTSVAGSQYVDSPGIGQYATYVVDEVRAAVEGAFPTTGRWGVVGRSSGGFGALHLAMRRPGTFQAVGAHAADLGFDLCYLADLPAAVTGVRMLGGLEGFVRAFWERHDPPGPAFAAMNVICMACAYSPDAAAKPIPAQLPVDFETGAVDFDVLRAWRAYDPIERVASEAEGLRSLHLLFLDAGSRDEHHLQLGLRRFVKRLDAAGVKYVHEEFDGGHRATTWRFDTSLPSMAAALHL